MKKRILCVVLSVLITISMITLPAQAAAKPAFQWLVDFTKHEGDYDAASKTYDVSWYMDDSESKIIAMEYDLTDGCLYCWIVDGAIETLLVLTPNLDAPYEMYSQCGTSYAAQYRIYPGSYTDTTQLHYTQYSGSDVN